MANFAITCITSGYLLAWLRSQTGSIWPVVLAHAVNNAAIYFVGDPLTGDAGRTAWFAGESGVALTPASIAVALVWWWRDRRAAPGQPPGTTEPARDRATLVAAGNRAWAHRALDARPGPARRMPPVQRHRGPDARLTHQRALPALARVSHFHRDPSLAG